MNIKTLPNTPRAFFCDECKKTKLFRVLYVGYKQVADTIQISFSALCPHCHQRGLDSVGVEEWNEWVENGKELT